MDDREQCIQWILEMLRAIRCPKALRRVYRFVQAVYCREK